MRTAEQWGRDHCSCDMAMEWRRSLGTASQRTAWRRCQRGDWLIWQLIHGLSVDEFSIVMPALLRAVERIVERSIRSHDFHCGIPAVARWAELWLSGEDRSDVAAAGVERVARAAEAAALAEESACAADAARAALAAKWALEAETSWAAKSVVKAAAVARDDAELAVRAAESARASEAAWAAARAAAEAESWAARAALAAAELADGWTAEALRVAESAVKAAAAWAEWAESGSESASRWAAARSATESELFLQARDIRREIPTWPGEV